ncbi:MAG: (E)-4-hydroxy-3-methylbut-2-enyl-diphosphate synthase [Verrucomicrobiae bacterium]|nr:(E)-4-hydroxy-3-methylbut-2-enyl-diphosphate synthase [Verrucomicrobiae bacterium]
MIPTRYCPNPFFWQRRRTREVRVGHIGIGGDNPIRVQTMLISDTMNTEACVREAIPIIEAGCEILRITTPSVEDARNLKNIVGELRRRGFNTPIVADVHFVPAAALEAAEWCEKVRINPGNYADRKKFVVREYTDAEYEQELERLDKAFTPLVLKLKQLGRALRIGTNHGSLSDRIMNRYGDTPLGMVESALEFVRICRRHNYHDIVLSMKASNPKVMIEAYRLLVARLEEEGPDWNYPLHLGVTEAGEGEDGRIKSAVGIGALLEDGLGDTVRVSLTEDSVNEIPVCWELVRKYNALWEQQRRGQRPEPPRIEVIELRDPFQYNRRPTHETVIGGLRLGRDHPPRVELPLPLTATVGDIQRVTTNEKDTFAEILQFRVQSPADLDRLAQLKPQLRAAHIYTPIAVTLDSADATLSVWDVADKVNIPFSGSEDLSRVLSAAENRCVQIDLCAQSPQHLVETCRQLQRLLSRYPYTPVILAVRRAEGLDVIAAHRVLAAHADRHPMLLRDRLESSEPVPEQAGPVLRSSTIVGSLLCDGIGDLVEVTALDEPLANVKLAYNILQAAGCRSFKTDYVACPSCGRTLFDLQTVTARIKARTSHLKGVKIAVMGCIVNGPGEMADADFGYVGTAPGRVSLWVGKQQVKQHIPEDQAVDELIALIRQHGKWIDPPSSS